MSTFPKKPLFWIWLIASIGIHALLLRIPLQFDAPTQKVERDRIQIVKLPPTPSSLPKALIQPAESPSPEPSPPPAPVQSPIRDSPQTGNSPPSSPNAIAAPAQFSPRSTPSKPPSPNNPSPSPKVTPKPQQAEAAFDLTMQSLSKLKASSIDVPEFYFEQPDLFYQKSATDPNSYDIEKPLAGFDGNFTLILEQTPEQVFTTFFQSKLDSTVFRVVPQPNYGGGLVYEIQQGDFVRYLNLVPTKDQTGTIVVIWNKRPN
ncbi:MULTISPECIES: hypothetical protein [Leptolyngbya]|uniref:hypothetical protein n=1 Tax=Leptolyngbya TaxID=47251 RepID=UPI001688AD0C|nr:hypothetical protein [Leptolyngbya sp. FACHB-1624]MBD1857577.1 hypothetical protein [Leptolyngbya sp. FACHB-1624]